MKQVSVMLAATVAGLVMMSACDQVNPDNDYGRTAPAVVQSNTNADSQNPGIEYPPSPLQALNGKTSRKVGVENPAFPPGSGN